MRRGGQRNPTLAKVGDLVVLTQACPVPALRGVLGQVYGFSKTNNQRALLQLIVGDEYKGIGGESVSQWIGMSYDVGLLPIEYTICPAERRVALTAACYSKTVHGNRGVGPYSLNAIFDTGSNTLLSFAQKLFTDLVKLDRPEEVEGLDGYHCVATHVGTVTMILGTHQRVFKDAYYCPTSVHTIVPGTQFDNEEYYFMGKDRSIHIVKR
jgi:hypothetical protein